MSNENIKITPEVFMDDSIIYLVCINGEQACFVRSEKEARLVVDSLASYENKLLQGHRVKIFREDLNNGQKVVLSKQKIGLVMNSAISDVYTIEYTAVGRAILKKGRLDVTKSMMCTGTRDLILEIEDMLVSVEEYSDDE